MWANGPGSLPMRVWRFLEGDLVWVQDILSVSQHSSPRQVEALFKCHFLPFAVLEAHILGNVWLNWPPGGINLCLYVCEPSRSLIYSSTFVMAALMLVHNSGVPGVS